MANRITLVGNIGADPEKVVFESGGEIANTPLATSLKWKTESGEKKEKTTWHQLQFRKGLVSVVMQYVKKGSKLYIEGMQDNYSFQDKDGSNRTGTRVIVQNMEMLGSKSDQSQQTQPATLPNDADDDLPF